MSNMSYCRFQNTSQDFRDCLQALRDMLENQGDQAMEEEGYEVSEDAEQFKDLSQNEKRALDDIMSNCEEFMEIADELLELNNK